MAVYITTIGVVLLPIGVVILVEKPDLDTLAYWLIVGGVIFAILGLIFTVKEDREKRAEAQKTEQRREAEDRRREEEYKRGVEDRRRYSIFLSAFAKRWGISMWRVNRKVRRLEDEDKFKEEFKDDNL